MKYEVLGEIRVSGRAGVATPATKKAETLFAILLARSNQMVTADQIVTEIWGEAAPRRANAALYVYISQLRKLLRDADHENSAILTRPRGYTLCVEPAELDVDVFKHLAEQGQRLAQSGLLAEAADAFEAGLRLWRGPAFGRLVESPIVYAYATLLDELRLVCQEQLTVIELKLSRHRECIGRLSALITEHPLRETFYQYLMVALARSDRRAEALDVYHTARRLLLDEIGIEPCDALRDLHQSILLGENLDRYADDLTDTRAMSGV